MTNEQDSQLQLLPDVAELVWGGVAFALAAAVVVLVVVVLGRALSARRRDDGRPVD